MTKNLSGIITKIKLKPGEEGKVLIKIQEVVETMDLRALKKNAIIRGLPFEELGNLSVLRLCGWIIKNFNNVIDIDLLDKYDVWAEKFMRERKMDDCFFHPCFKLGFVGETDEEGKILTIKKPRDIIKPKKAKKVRTSQGIFLGTKKAYTYELQSKGTSKEKTIELVLLKFPEAQEKSILIWWKRSAKANGTPKKK
jgi:hypothetical protein